MMMMTIFFRLRMATHPVFVCFEHICAMGYAMDEFKIHYGKQLLIIGSFGLLTFGVFLLIDHLVRKLRSAQETVLKLSAQLLKIKKV
jgi:hypothetical protein